MRAGFIIFVNNKMRNEAHHRELFNNSTEIVYTLDLAGNFTFLNNAGERISGYSCEEARRMNIAEVVAPEFAEQLREQIRRNVRERFGAVYEIDIIAKDGDRVALEVSTRVILRDGRPIEIQGIAVPSVVRSQSSTALRLRCLDTGCVFGSLLPR